MDLFDTEIPNVRSGTVAPDDSIWFGNTSDSTLVVRLSGDLTSAPRLLKFDTHIPGPSFPVFDLNGDLWFGTSGASQRVARLSGEADSPSIQTLSLGVEAPGFPILDNQGGIWFGNVAEDGSEIIVRLDSGSNASAQVDCKRQGWLPTTSDQRTLYEKIKHAPIRHRPR